ncbi:MAG: EAL domain-containing protein [Burkholderiales bacterium]|nr:EAL domain-containing protein [Burkholderiales bacterium]
MSSLASEAILERESFLETPALFRWGPLGVFITWLAFLVTGLMLAQWRVNAGREADYARALDSAGGSAHAALHDMAQLQQQLEGAAAHAGELQRLSGDVRILERYLSGQFGDRGPVRLAALLDRDGRIVAASPSAPRPAGPPGQPGPDPRAQRLRWGQPLPMADGSTCLPLELRIDGPGAVSSAVFCVDLPQFLGPTLAGLGPYGGWLHIEFADGAGRLDLVRSRTGTLAYGMPQGRRFETAEEAMRAPLDFESQDWLTAWRHERPPGMRAAAGLTVEAALVDSRARVWATFVIIGVLALLLGVLSFLFAYAIRKFARQEAYLRQLAAIDELTGLPNRRSANALLKKQFERASRQGERLALLYIDVDDFKAVNDSAGHVEGDTLLKSIAARLREFFDGRGLVFRLGGDEFMVIVPRPADDASLRELALRMLDRLHEPTAIMGSQFRPRASVGVAVYPTQASSVDDLLMYADTAMYHAKDEGRHRVVLYAPALAQQALDKAMLARDLERALETNALHLVYQPKFDARQGTLSGFEALARWDHPTRGAVPPGTFIPIAEHSALIVEIGRWVLRTALRQVREWHASRGVWHQVAVNVSAIQLHDAAWVPTVREALHASGVPASCLQLELTETALADDPLVARDVLRQLRALGVGIAIDDFGTGYSSMTRLQTLELDLLKLDRSFVAAIDTDSGREVCRAVISLGHGLGLKVLAEGVETEHQYHRLIRLGCDEVQGYLFARPLSPALAIEQSSIDVEPHPSHPVALPAQGPERLRHERQRAVTPG